MIDIVKAVLSAIATLLIAPLLTFTAAYLAIQGNSKIEAEKARIARAEVIMKLKADLVSDNPRERVFASETLRELGLGNYVEKMRKALLVPARLRIYIQNAEQREAVGDVATKLKVPQSAISTARPFTKFPESIEIRFFDDNDFEMAHHIASLAAPLAAVRRGPPNTERRGAIEVWVPMLTLDTYSFGSTTFDTSNYGGTWGSTSSMSPAASK